MRLSVRDAEGPIATFMAIGFLQSEGATIAIRDGYGRVQTIARDDLAARVPLKSSLMPDPLALALTAQDVADIVAFLMKDG